MIQIDRVIHEPVRLKIMMVLSGVAWADFPSLCRMFDITRGNLSAHMSRLESCKYIRVKKTIVGKIPHTQYQLTKTGQTALERYWTAMDEIRRLADA